jgi:hypothetical protein
MNVLEQLDMVQLQYRQHNLRPGLMEVRVVRTAQDSLQNIDSGLDTIQLIAQSSREMSALPSAQ